ncbi:hypothetical protein TIFTF001_032039 [Ficus carica]|uniref:DUF8039 domain-containing protein n=1 Tax=Ficus carica TaxID=3494 RepID=A0AA88DWQ3_FICCA|nr:hypothetical protein TIFTF001_032039 [Ficus carica]
MRRVHQVRTKGERIAVSFDEKGQPLGKEGDELQSWIGVLAREHIPIWISNFRSADLPPRKERVWVEIVTSFTIELSFKKQALKSCAESAKNFRYDIYQAFVRDHIDEETVWQRLPKMAHNYPTISQEDWEKFIEYRRTPEFKRLSEQGSEIRKKSKYGSTGGRDRYRKRDQAHDDFSEQETQGSFESVGTNDILTKALGNAEHSGRIRGQSNFKASCTLNEKEVRPSDPKPMPNESKECQLFIPDLINGGDVLVANGRAYMDCVPTDTVHGIPLGEENVRVTITVLKIKRELLPNPTNEATCIEEAVGAFVAWPKRLVVVQTSLSQASQGPNHAPDKEDEGNKRTKKRAGRKKIQSQPEVQQQPAQEELPSFDFNEIPFELRPLAYYIQSSMRDGTQIMCPLQQFVIGDDMPIYIGFEDVYHFITFKEISANSIMVYIRYLADCCARTSMDQRFEFISPVLVLPVQRNVDRVAYVQERAEYILRILRNAPKGKRFLMPYNSGQHWVLVVIDPWDDSVLYFNPLGNEPGDDFKYLITTALNDWKLLVGRGIRQRRNCHGLAVLQTNDFYTDADMTLGNHGGFPVNRRETVMVFLETTTVSVGNRCG